MTILQKHLVFIPLCVVAFVALFGWLVMMLWNWLIPDLTGWSTIGYGQAVGLLLLCKILFGGIGGSHHGHGHSCRCCGENKLLERWETMTPEERKLFIESHKSDRSADGMNGDGN